MNRIISSRIKIRGDYMGWIDEAVVYHIYPLGLCGAPQENDFKTEAVSRIKKLEEWIEHLLDMGITAVYLGPIFESTSHGYDTADYYQIDRRLGTNEDFKELAKKLHEAGIRIILDGVFNHVGRDFGPFKDVKVNRQNSRYVNWFHNINFSSNSPYGDSFSYEGWEGHFNLVKLNLYNQEVVDYLFGAVKQWVEEYDIDGLRLDVAYSIDMDFLRKLKAFCISQKEDFWLMGEMIHGDYNRLAGPNGIDSATNYECYKGIYSSHNDANYFEINHSLNRLFGSGGIYKELFLYNFVDNHDVARIASILKSKEHIKNVYTLLFTMPGMPSVYYGSEWMIEGNKESGSDKSLRPELDIKEMLKKDQDLVSHIKRLAAIRKEQVILQKGNYEQVVVRNKQLIFSRNWQGQKIYVVLNLEDKQVNMCFDTIYAGSMKDYLSNQILQINNGKVEIDLPAFSSMILVYNDSDIV